MRRNVAAINNVESNFQGIIKKRTKKHKTST
jgi:hypothetical protein